MIRSGLLLPLLYLTLCLKAPAAEPLSDAARNDFLARLDARREQGGGGMEANFTETKNSRLLKDPLVTRGVMAFQSPDRFRREIQGNNKSLTVSNGKTLWIYYPNFNEVEVYDMGAHSFFDDSITALISGLSYKKIPEVYNVEAFREASGYRLELTPKKRNLRRIVERMTLWINEDLEPARTVVSLPKGDRIVTQYSNVRRRGFPASDFEFSPPAGASISRPMGKK